MSIAKELENIRRMPYGTARIAAAEAAARKVEAEGPKEKLAEALLDLVEAYTFAGQGAKSFVVFARLLRHWDEHPELFDASDEHNLFWEFKWVASDLPDYAQIGRAQAEAFLNDMQRRFELQGIGLSAVRASRFGWVWQSGSDGAEEARLAWVTTPRDDFDDCRACTIGQQTDFFLEQGRYAEALEMGLTQDSRCNLEPTKTHFATALAALNVGDAAQALRSHRLALATIAPGNRDLAQSRGQGFELLARGGHLERALRELRVDYRQLLTDPPSPLLHLRFLLGVLAGLSANLDSGELATGMPLPGEPVGDATVAELHAWVEARVREHAADFDARSGTDYYARLADRATSAVLAEAPLDFESGSSGRGPGVNLGDESGESGEPRRSGEPGGIAEPTDAVSAPGAGSAAGESDAGEPDAAAAAADPEPDHAADAESLLRWAEAALARKDYGGAARGYERAAAELESAGWIERAGLASAEGAQCASLDSDEERAHRLFAVAVPLLRSGGAGADTLAAVLAAWAPVAARMNDAAAQIRATAAALEALGEFDDEGLTEELAERMRGEWLGQRATLRDTLARSVAASGTVPDAGLDRQRAVSEALTAGEEFAQLGRIGDAAHAFWLAGRVQRELGESEAAVWSLESAFEGFTVAREREDRVIVAGELIELLRATGQTERADRVVEEL